MPLGQSLAQLYGKAVPPVNSPSPAEPAESALSPAPGAAAKPTVINQPPSTSAAQMPTANNPLKQAAPIMPSSTSLKILLLTIHEHPHHKTRYHLMQLC